MTTKNLEYYDQNPHELGSLDPETQEALMKELAAIDGAPAAAPVTPEPVKLAETPKADASDGDGKEKDESTAVLAPDGKSTIPYAVLQGERTQRAAAERALAEMGDTVTALNERLAALEAGEKDPGAKAGQSADEIEQAIAKLEEESPALGEAMREITSAMMATIRKQEEALTALTTDREQTDEELRREVNEQVQRAIDSQPALVAWKAGNPELWAQCGKIDDALKLDTAWQDKPYEERFAKVVEAMVAIHGESILPAGAPRAPKVEPPAPKPDAETIRKAAEAKLTAVEPKAITLTDMPPGAAPENSEQEKLENITVQQLHAKMAGMNPQQLQAYLRDVSV